MRSAGFAEWVLARVMEREQAASVVGDLLETAKTDAGFWISALRVLVAAAWRRPVAWITGYVVGTFLYWFVNFELLRVVLRMHAAHILRLHEHGMGLAAMEVLLYIAIPLWFVGPYLAVRFGARDRTARLAMVLCGIATVGLIASRYEGVLSKYCFLTCAVVAVGVVVGVVTLAPWRRPAWVLIITNVLGLAGSALIFRLTWTMMTSHHAWSDSFGREIMPVLRLLVVSLMMMVGSLAHGFLRVKRPGHTSVV